MKSIYEEALEICEDLHKVSFEMNVPIDTFEIPIKALEQAQKQEKLLNLYQNLYHDFHDLTIYEKMDIQKQIKEIENEINL